MLLNLEDRHLLQMIQEGGKNGKASDIIYRAMGGFDL